MRITVGNTATPTIHVQDNSFNRCVQGLLVSGSQPRVHAYRNTFRKCEVACQTQQGGRLFLGNLGNSSTADNGANLFQTSNTWHIRNYTPRTLLAEGNQFHTTDGTAIHARIWDDRDDASLGPVDIDPLIGGTGPSGGTSAVAAITTAAALPTAGGAEIAFTLSAAAEVGVEVLNLAGRPVAVIEGASPRAAGAQRLLWNARTSAGTQAPAGHYLIRIRARGPLGDQSSVLCSLTLSR